MFRTLLKYSADPEYRNADGTTAVHYLSFLSDSSIVDLLVEQSIFLNKQDSTGNSPVHYAARNGNLVQVNALLRHGAFAHMTNREGEVALHWAVTSKISLHRSEIIRTLLAAGADSNDPDAKGITSFMHALQRENLETIQIMLGYGADMHSTSESGDGCLHFAAANPDLRVLKFLLDQGFPATLENKDKTTILHIAAKEGNYKACRFLLDLNLDVDCVNKLNATPLHYAVKSEQDDVISLLLDRGADIHAKGNDKCGVFTIAQSGSPRILHKLLRHIAINYVLNRHVDDDDLHFIYRDCQIGRYLKNAKLELNRSRFHEFMSAEDVTVQDLITVPTGPKLLGWMRNEELVMEVKEQVDERKYPIFLETVKERFLKQAFEEIKRISAAKVLAGIFQLDDYFIGDNILQYLTLEELTPLIPPRYL